MVLEEEPIASTLLQQRGYTVTTRHPRTITTSHDTTTMIRGRKFSLMWLDFPSSGRSLPPGKRPASTRQLCLWIQQCKESGIPCILIGLRGRHWQDQNLANLVTDKIVSEATIHLCHFNIKVTEDTDKPSAVKLHAYTTFPLRPFRCPHAQGAEHHYELGNIGQGRGRLWTEARSKLYRELLEKHLDFVSLRREPDCSSMHESQHETIDGDTTSSAFPTTAKEAAKQRKKEGHVAKKKIKIIEERDKYDDIGEDLSGLGKDIKTFMQDVTIEYFTANEPDDPIIDGILTWFPLGNPTTNTVDHVYAQSSLESSLQLLFQSGYGIDFIELCGGAGRPSQLAIRRKLQVGQNFDLVTGFDSSKTRSTSYSTLPETRCWWLPCHPPAGHWDLHLM